MITKQNLFNLMAMAIIVAGVSCAMGDKEQPKEPLKIDVALTQDEIAKGLLTPEILWKFGRVGNPQLSPCGKLLVYTITYYNLQENKGVTNLYVISTDGGEPRKLTDEIGSDSNPQWSPDGKSIRFISTRGGSSQIWEVSPDGSNLHQVSKFESEVNGFWFSPDGSKVLYALDVKLEDQAGDIYPDMPKAQVRIINDLMYRHWNYWEDGLFSHIFVADFVNGEIENPKDINQGEKWDTPMSTDFDITEVQWSPDGKFITYCSKKYYGKEYAVTTNSDIYLYSLETGETQNLTAENPMYIS